VASSLNESAGTVPATEDRIRELCHQALAANDDNALREVLPELRAAIKEHCHNERLKAAEEIPQVFRPIGEVG
jgi:hypothetical protein